MSNAQKKEYYRYLNTRTSLYFILHALENFIHYKQTDGDGGEYIAINKTCKRPLKLMLLEDPQQTLDTYLFSKITRTNKAIRLYIHTDIDYTQIYSQYVNSAYKCFNKLSDAVPSGYHMLTFSANGDTGNEIHCALNENENKNNLRYYGVVAFKYDDERKRNNNNNKNPDILPQSNDKSDTNLNCIENAANICPPHSFQSTHDSKSLFCPACGQSISLQ